MRISNLYINCRLHNGVRWVTDVKKQHWGEKDRELRTEVSQRHKPPCLSADPPECNHQVSSVISGVIIFRSSIQANGQITEQWTGCALLHCSMFFPTWCLYSKLSPWPAECSSTCGYLRHVMDFFTWWQEQYVC